MNYVQNWNIHLWQLKKWEVDSNIKSNEEICGGNSSNNKIWWRRLPGDGTSEDMVSVILARKQEIKIRISFRSFHSSGNLIVPRSFWRKIHEEDRPKITDRILFISKQLKSVQEKERLRWKVFRISISCSIKPNEIVGRVL